jgi:hypothetical protein
MNAVLLAAPLIVFAIVLLVGFAGCSLDKEGIPSGESTGQWTGTGPFNYSAAVTSSSPIAYWRLSDPQGSDIAKDEIGAPTTGDHPGTYLGDVKLTLGTKPGLNASDPVATPARFDGESSVEVPHAPEFEMVAFTVEALVHPDKVVGGVEIVSNMSAAGGWALSIASPDEAGTGANFVASVRDGAVLSDVPPVGFELAKLGTAWHLAMTFDDKKVLTLYMDGAVNSAASPVLYAPNQQEPLRIGVNFQGAIQEVAVYDYALDHAQILAHFMANMANPGP